MYVFAFTVLGVGDAAEAQRARALVGARLDVDSSLGLGLAVRVRVKAGAYDGKFQLLNFGRGFLDRILKIILPKLCAVIYQNG